jgi:hypothetical protein
MQIVNLETGPMKCPSTEISRERYNGEPKCVQQRWVFFAVNCCLVFGGGDLFRGEVLPIAVKLWVTDEV